MRDGAHQVSAAADVAAALDRLVGARPPLLLVVDFDGTLAPVTLDSGATTIDPMGRRAMRRLARIAADRPGRLLPVVLTGRTALDVAVRVRVGGVEYLGDHGLQHGRLGRGARPERLAVSAEPGFEAHADPAETLASGVSDELGHPRWLFVERKGPSVAFHVRQAEDVAAARAAVVDAIGAVERRHDLVDHGLAHYRGRSVVDLRPRDAGGKREAVARLIERDLPGGIVALGDELSDVDAFAAVVDARGAVPGLVGVTIAVHGRRPAPAELSALADLHVGSARAVARLLMELAQRLEREDRP